MSYVSGKIKKIIFHNNDNGYVVALFRIKETDDDTLQEKINRTITITGIFTDVNIDIPIMLYGRLVENEKYGTQYVVDRVEIETPTTKDAIIEFLSSSFIDGCGEKTAKRIVDKLGEDTLNLIKENKDVLLEIDGLTTSRIDRIYNSLTNYNKSSEVILELQNMGFSIDECSRIYNKFKEKIDSIMKDDFYDLKEIIDFKKLDSIFKNKYGENNTIRYNACIIEAMQIISNTEGDTYYYIDQIREVLERNFLIYLTNDELNGFLTNLSLEVVIDKDKYYLKKYYDMEINVARALKKINDNKPREVKDIDEKLKTLEERLKIDYNEVQEKAIKTALNNNITIISGGPGTGKTTIINAIVKLYIDERKLGPADILGEIALLAPTGRASKKLSTSTNMPAYTIHRYLKWYKDSNEFVYNKFNKTNHRLIIVDEVSMIDLELFSALLDGIRTDIKLVLVGDTFQLPSVSAGLVLNDLIDSDYFNYVPLNQIYRQSENSYIPYLCREIKNNDLSEDFMNKRDDYSFFPVNSAIAITKMIEQIINISRDKGIDEHSMQVLAPMYRGDAGIDNLNHILQRIYNPHESGKNEIVFGDVVYREGDKILQLVNDLDKNVFNGDIGYIENIYSNKIEIDFEGKTIEYEKKDLIHIKHAYAITIHKSQGSEFEHVIMPVSQSYSRMLYNKLIYTGVSRAKKSITIVGDPNAFIRAVHNNYSSNRKTSLKDKLIEIYNKI